MLNIPVTERVHRVLAIDNGTNTLGTVVADIDLGTAPMHVIYADTCTANDTADRHQWVADMHGNRFARYEVLFDYMSELLNEYDPDIVVIEAPFMHRRPESFATLRESLYVLRQAVMEYRPALHIELVPPILAKKAVGMKVFTQGKESVRDAVLRLKDVTYVEDVNPTQLDEHCIDAVAVAYHERKRVMAEYDRRR